MLAASLFLGAASAGAQVRGSLSGIVQDSAGAFIVGAEVMATPGNHRTVTNASGAFRIERLAPGGYQVQIRRLGYSPVTIDVSVAPGQQAVTSARLATLPFTLGTVAVRERRESFDSRLAGFNARRQKGIGHFFTREELDRRSHNLVDVLREVPGVRVGPIRMGRTIRMRGNCPALFVIDGSPASAGTFDADIIDLAGYEAVEVYSSAATVPPELMAARGLDRCGVIALWSRPYRPRRVSGSAARGGQAVKEMLDAGAVFSAENVDQPARLLGETLNPVYPESMWLERVAGRVLLEFVVNEKGDVELGTAAVVASTNSAFAAAARAALPEARFQPALRKGRPVRQIVHLPVAFEAPPA